MIKRVVDARIPTVKGKRARHAPSTTAILCIMEANPVAKCLILVLTGVGGTHACYP